MISFNNLGYNGRFGNQMFQYAALIGFAVASNQKWGLPKQNSEIRKKVGSLGYEEKFELPDCFDLKYNYTVQAPTHRFYEDGNVYVLPEGTDINGYFQSEKYFVHAKEEVKRQYTFKKDIQEKSFSAINDAEIFISIHVRRGDYTTLQQYHPLIDIEWYQTAMKQFGQTKYLLFSDDIQWCKGVFGSHVDYFESKSSHIDMCTMSRCRGHIIANSSFSWWAAYLSGNKTIAPKNWFGKAIDHKNDGSIYPSNWTIL